MIEVLRVTALVSLGNANDTTDSEKTSSKQFQIIGSIILLLLEAPVWMRSHIFIPEPAEYEMRFSHRRISTQSSRVGSLLDRLRNSSSTFSI